MIGDDFNTPIMYQDLANSTMGPMPYTVGVPMTNGYITGGYGRSLLGGTKMRRQLDNDKIEIMNQKEKQDKSTFKIALWVIGGALALGSIPVLRNSIKKAGGFKKYAKNCWTSLKNFVKGTPNKQGNWFTRLFKRKKTAKP